MIIYCRGIWCEGLEECSFIHHGKWGDKELNEHEKIELDKENKTTFWLGFKRDDSYSDIYYKGSVKNVNS